VIVAIFIAARVALAGSAHSPPPACASLSTIKAPGRCEVSDRTPPRELPGSVDNGQYCFEHVTDADQSTDNGVTAHTYRHWLINWHQNNELDAEWTKAQISFRAIAPRDCAATTSSSGLPPREDPDAFVRYGRVRNQLTPKQASVYAADSGGQVKNYPPLLGSVYAGLLLPRGELRERFVVDITTRSEFKTTQVFLQIENRGDKNLIYSVPALAASIGKERFDAAVRASMWTRVAPDSDWFQIAGGVNYANLLVDRINAVVEARTQIRFARAAAPNVVIGEASIPVYVPR
jgi:hypothetical protein